MLRFILTRELGKLARWLRILGFDTVYFNSNNMGTLIIEALREDRIIVTRRKSKIDNMKKVVVIEKERVKDQLRELINKLNLKVDEEKMFTRCVLCNKLLETVAKDSVKNKIPPYVYETHNHFMQCSQCWRIYWEGSHWGNIKEVLKGVI